MPTHMCVTSTIERLLAFDKYQEIMDKVRSVNVSTDADFRKLFDSYYEVRRNELWRDKYFSYFETVKNNDQITFDEIVDYCYNNLLTAKRMPNPVEASFSSKMLATINPIMPILDSQVMANMGLKIEGASPSEKLASAKEVYKEICQRYSRYIGTADCKYAVSLFDTYFPDYTSFTDTRKVDWFLWGLKKEELQSIGKFGALL